MHTPTSDCRQLVPMRESTAILKLTLQRNIPAGRAGPGKGAHSLSHDEMEVAAAPVHQPTPAECYGCVDWFHY
jgi:hypothetical protein